jgi:hypothetical protein
MSERAPSVGEVIKAALAKALGEFRVCIPVRVERYDVSKGLVDVQPLIKNPRYDENGDRIAETLPVICNVPVEFPGAGGMRITFPIQKGDTGEVVFADLSLDIWLDRGGIVDPLDDRRHHLSDAIFRPGLKPFNAPWTGDTSVITIGSDAGAADFVALASKVTAALNDLAAGVTTAGGTVPPTFDPNVASATVKIKG